MIKHRWYEPADLERVVAVYHAAVHALAAPFYRPEQLEAWSPESPDLERWKQRLDLLRTLIAEQDGTIAGFISYDHQGHLDLLFTHPDFARRGIATHLYDRVEWELRMARTPRVFTEASLAARPFFERWGFEVDAEELVEVRGAQLRRFRMHKRLVGD